LFSKNAIFTPMYDELKYWYLRDHKLFWTLSMSQIKQLCIITGFKKAKKGDIIYFSSSDVPRVFLLKKGNIKIVAVDEDGNETIKDIIQKGDLFGELTLESDANSNEYAKALTDEIIICSFLLSDFEELLLQNPSLALSYTKFVGLKMKRIKNSYSNLISKDAKTRLYQFLKDWAEKEGKRIGNKVVIENYLTQNDIAQIICTSRQTATQLLNEMETKSLLLYNRKEIIIEDITKL
jgi:CRP-like cAMP-binding protein